jgi:catechol 2,3-dioxygenase-like lactoylglutathione lyase family enzyme
VVAFDEVAEKITGAARQIEPDRDASPVLEAVVPGVPGEACEGSRCSALGEYTMASIGIRHVHLLVAEHDRAISFYGDVFGMEERFRDGPIVFLGTPDGGDSLALHLATTEEERARIGGQGGWEHFGIHLPNRSADGIDGAVARVRDACGQLLSRGEHAPGVHYAYVTDLDGYAIEN